MSEELGKGRGITPREQGSVQKPSETGNSIEAGKQLIQGEPKNPWEDQLRAIKELTFDIPDKFQNIADLPEGTHIDPLTGLPLEEDNMRRLLAARFSRALVNTENWAFIYVDVDNLKTGNTKFNRKFGDMVIREGVARVTSTINDLNLPEGVEIITVRQTGAADETIMWFFNLNEDQQQQINNSIPKIEKSIKTANPEFTFSSTATFISSGDPRIQTLNEQAKNFISVNPQDNIAHDEYDQIKDLADQEVKLKKIARDIERMPAELLSKACDFEEARNILIKNLGDSRLSTPLLNNVVDVVRFETVCGFRDAFSTFEEFNVSALKAGIAPEIINHFTSEKPRVSYYNTLIH